MKKETRLKTWIKSKKGCLFCAVVFTVLVLMYVATALRMGVYAAFERPSLFANGLLFGFSLALAVICWYRWLFYKPDRKEFAEQNHRPATCWALAAFCAAGALFCGLLYILAERSRLLPAASVFLLACTVVWVRRGLKARNQPDGAEK